MRRSPRPSAGRPLTTRSGKVLKVHRSLGEHYNAMREAKTLRKVNRLRGLPKSRLKRIAWRLHPKRLAAYWFSRDGGIMALKIGGIVIVILFVVTLGVFAYFRKDLKSITDLSGSNLGGSISYYDRTGTVLLWQDYNAVKRVPVQSQAISPYMKEATVSIEDKDFYKHRGFDIKGIVRAAFVDVLHRGGTQGGSTITEQLVKLTRDFNQNRSISLKVKELILAVELERTYTKDEILTDYLNVAPYGSVDYGVQAAASDYFHVDAKNLTLAQAAFLASIPKSPSVYSPYDQAYFDKQALLDRYNYVLELMADQGKITHAQASAAEKVDVLAQVQSQQTLYAGIKAPYFVLAAKGQLENQFTTKTAKVGGWKVITTLDMNMQKTSEDRVAANLPNVKRYGGDEEATVTEDVQTGQMMALVGGVDFNDPDHGTINYAQWPISPGSSIKPYDYSALIQNTSAGAGSVFYDIVDPLPGYPCTNRALPPKGNCLWDFDRKSPGAESIRYALGGSRNIPAVKATLQVVPGNTQASINKVDDLADAMMDGDVGYHCYKDGVDVTTATASDQMECTPSSGIGDGGYLHLDQHMNGLATLGRMGQAIPTTYILKIYDGTSNKPFYNWTQPKTKQVMNPQTAYIMDNMLSDPQASYLGGSNKFQHYKGWDIAVKTGTTNDNYDGLMMAWSTKYAVGTWVGYHTRTKALTTEMENLTEPVTKYVIEADLDASGAKPVNWTQPSGIQTLPAYHSALPYSTMGPTVSTDIFPSWYKPKTTSSQSQTLDKVSGKLATSCTPPLAKQVLGGKSAPNAFSIDSFYPPGQTSSSGTVNTTANDDVHSCSDSPPSIASFFINGQDASGGGTFDCSSGCAITTTVTAGTHPFSDTQYAQYPGTVSLLVNGSAVQSQQVSDSPSTVSFNYSGSGSVTVAVQVTDSVLYSAASGNATITFASSLSFGSAHAAAGTTTVNWSGGSGIVTVKDGALTLCSASASSGTCNGSSTFAPKNSTVNISDTSGGSDSGQVN